MWRWAGIFGKRESVLKSKKRNTQEDWLTAYRYAQLERDVERSERLIEKALARIPKEGKKFYGWSGGKDALAMQVVCERAGIHDCVLGSIGERWEYPAFWSYLMQNKPPECQVKAYDLTVEFMNEHENMVFPTSSKDSYRWFPITYQRTWNGYKEEVQADYILLGHRKLDGNNLSSKNGKIYPIFDFTHEDIFCIIACNDLDLAPSYFYPRGFYQGTRAWVMRSGKNAVDEIYDIDPNILVENRDVRKVNEYLIRREYGT